MITTCIAVLEIWGTIYI